MPVTLGARAEHGFDQPLGLMSDCHRRIERFLAILDKVAERAEGRLLDGEERRAVEAALTYFSTAAPRHTADEEQSLFPRLCVSREPRAKAVLTELQELERDHAVADRRHARVEAWFRWWIEQGALPEGQGRRLLLVLKALREMYRRHIAVEEQKIFPLAVEVLSGEELAVVGQEMAARRGVRGDHAAGVPQKQRP